MAPNFQLSRQHAAVLCLPRSIKLRGAEYRLVGASPRATEEEDTIQISIADADAVSLRVVHTVAVAEVLFLPKVRTCFRLHPKYNTGPFLYQCIFPVTGIICS
jgi:hypothetical protein